MAGNLGRGKIRKLRVADPFFRRNALDEAIETRAENDGDVRAPIAQARKSRVTHTLGSRDRWSGFRLLGSRHDIRP